MGTLGAELRWKIARKGAAAEHQTLGGGWPRGRGTSGQLEGRKSSKERRRKTKRGWQQPGEHEDPGHLSPSAFDLGRAVAASLKRCPIPCAQSRSCWRSTDPSRMDCQRALPAALRRPPALTAFWPRACWGLQESSPRGHALPVSSPPPGRASFFPVRCPAPESRASLCECPCCHAHQGWAGCQSDRLTSQKATADLETATTTGAAEPPAPLGRPGESGSLLGAGIWQVLSSPETA